MEAQHQSRWLLDAPLSAILILSTNAASASKQGRLIASPKLRWLLDRPVKPGDDSVGVLMTVLGFLWCPPTTVIARFDRAIQHPPQLGWCGQSPPVCFEAETALVLKVRMLFIQYRLWLT
jgi:hypothetical protein